MPTIQTVESFNVERAINDVPLELLVEICTINALQDPWPKDHLQENIRRPQSRLPQNILDTIHASHVCRRWREILVSIPQLWKNMVDPYDIEWSNMILERSAPLGVVFVPFRGLRGDRDLGKELAMIGRLRERLAEYHVDQIGRHLPAIPDHFVFSTLEVLSLSGHGQLPQSFPGEATPALKTLHLAYGIPPSLECVTAISQTLTKLFVIRPYKRRAVAFWGDLMSQLPCLEVIALKFCFARVDYDLVDSRTIFRTNVLEFSVHGFGDHLLTFIPRIEFGKPLTRLTVKSHLSVDADAIHLPELESHLIQTFSDKASRVIQHNTLGVAGTWVFELDFEDRLDYPSNSPSSISPLDVDKGKRNRWLMDISCVKPPGLPDLFPNLLTPLSCNHIDVLNIYHFHWSWESLCPIFCNFTNLQLFRATTPFVLKFMHHINSSKHALNIFPALRGIYLDASHLNVWGYRDMFPSNSGSVDDEDLKFRINLLTQDWGDQSDGSSSIYNSDSSDNLDSDEGDEVEEVVDKDGNRWDDHSFIQEFESISVEQVINFCKARPSIEFVSFLDVPGTEAFVILRERLGEMGVEIRKHDANCLDMFTK